MEGSTSGRTDFEPIKTYDQAQGVITCFRQFDVIFPGLSAGPDY
jgi:hypothetical protein